MRTWFLLGSLAAGVLFCLYEFYQQRESAQADQNYGRGFDGSDDEFDDGNSEYIEIGDNRIIDRTNSSSSERRPMPGADELCPICQDRLFRRSATRKYCLVSLPICGHWFHQKCAIRLMEYHPSCPVCRIGIDSAQLKNTPVRLVQSSFIQTTQADLNSLPNNNQTGKKNA